MTSEQEIEQLQLLREIAAATKDARDFIVFIHEEIHQLKGAMIGGEPPPPREMERTKCRCKRTFMRPVGSARELCDECS